MRIPSSSVVSASCGLNSLTITFHLPQLPANFALHYMAIFVVTVFLGSFLLFAVEPMVAKFLLPSFGGTAAVWSTCLVVFQTLLLAGYAYAHLLRTTLIRRLSAGRISGCWRWRCCSCPRRPTSTWRPMRAAHPVWALLRCLFTSIGVPFFALSATAPLLMEWFRQSFPGRSHDRLYAFSNAGSLLALLAYPALLEPAFTLITQAWLWAGGMGLFLVVCAAAAWRSRPGPALAAVSSPQPKVVADVSRRPLANDKNAPTDVGGYTRSRRGGRDRAEQALQPPLPAWLWVALPACGSGLLLALTNQLSQDVAPMPLLWVVPMAVYLLTFILCFEGPRSYKRGLFIPASFVVFFFLAWLLDKGYLHGFWLQVGGYLSVLFLGCMVCHGELYRLAAPPGAVDSLLPRHRAGRRAGRHVRGSGRASPVQHFPGDADPHRGGGRVGHFHPVARAASLVAFPHPMPGPRVTASAHWPLPSASAMCWPICGNSQSMSRAVFTGPIA